MNLANLVGLGAAAAFSYRIARRRGLQRTNPISLFALTWGPVLLLVTTAPDADPAMLQRTWNMIWLGFAGLVVGTLWACAAHPATRRAPAVVHVDPARLIRWHSGCLVVLCAFAVLQLVRNRPLVDSAGGYLAALSTAGGDLRRAGLARSVEAAQTALDASSAAAGVLNYLLFLGHVSIFTGALLYKLGRHRAAILPVLIAAVYGILSLQRASFVMTTLLFAFAVLVLPAVDGHPDATAGRPPDRRLRRRGMLPVAVVLTVGAVAVLLPLEWRNAGTRNSTGLLSLSQYVVSGVLGLNARNTWNPAWYPPPGNGFATVGPAPGLGAYTFTNLFGVAHRLGLPVPTAANFYDFSYVQIWGRRLPTNTGTAIVDYYYDFGSAGVVLMFLVVGALGTLLQRQTRSGRVARAPLAAFLLVVVAWSFFGNTVLNDIRYLLTTAVAGALVGRRLAAPAPVDLDRDASRAGAA